MTIHFMHNLTSTLQLQIEHIQMACCVNKKWQGQAIQDLNNVMHPHIWNKPTSLCNIKIIFNSDSLLSLFRRNNSSQHTVIPHPAKTASTSNISICFTAFTTKSVTFFNFMELECLFVNSNQLN